MKQAEIIDIAKRKGVPNQPSTKIGFWVISLMPCILLKKLKKFLFSKGGLA